MVESTAIQSLIETLSHTGYDHGAIHPEEFEGWHGVLTHEPGQCDCGPRCWCCDPISVTLDVLEILAVDGRFNIVDKRAKVEN